MNIEEVKIGETYVIDNNFTYDGLGHFFFVGDIVTIKEKSVMNSFVAKLVHSESVFSPSGQFVKAEHLMPYGTDDIK